MDFLHACTVYQEDGDICFVSLTIKNGNQVRVEGQDA